MRRSVDIETVIPGARGRIIGALMRLDGPRTISEVARLADVSRDQAATIVADLERLGLVERQHAGRAHLVSLVDEHPATQSLREIERTGDRTIDALRQSAREIDPAPSYMALYGSWARGDANTDSDLDVAVIAGAEHDHDALLEALDAWSRFAKRVTGRNPSLVIAGGPRKARGPLCGETPSSSSTQLGPTMPRDDSVAITKADAVAHSRQAEEYLRAAEHSLAIGDHNAAAGTPIDEGINAADAVAGMNLGRRWKGPHEQASQLVASAGVDGRDAKELRRLIPLKTQSQ